MTEYHKIQTVFKRDPANHHKTLLIGEWSVPAFGYLADNEWVFTEKVDGTNVRVCWDGHNVRFAGRTDAAQMPTFLYDELCRQMPMTGFVKADMPPCVLYGEGYGAKIQKGGGNYKADGVDFVLFDVRVGDWWLERENVEDIARKLGVYVVPVVGRGSLHLMVSFVENAGTSCWGDFPVEGIVARPAIELSDRGGHRVITKIKVRDFAHD